ncbi:hypothetical protein [Streptomyces sp. NPDC052107]|uniref:hypothetical protein n=1 Tax=Streptomyces sp. NPDC052107 TaxID=3155632 RepID=UPI00343AE2AE
MLDDVKVVGAEVVVAGRREWLTGDTYVVACGTSPLITLGGRIHGTRVLGRLIDEYRRDHLTK